MSGADAGPARGANASPEAGRAGSEGSTAPAAGCGAPAFGACPVPVGGRPQHIQLGHGGGGRLSAELLRQVFLPAFDDDVLAALEDQAVVPFALPGEGTAAPGARLAFTTDAFVVRPLFFPGGDIGRLAVTGTVNDLVVGGARPLYLSAAFVLEEGLEVAVLERIAASMRAACREAGVRLVTGDTKVVERGKGDQVFVATSGVGLVPPGRALSIARARPGDRVVVSGTIGDHGVAVMSVREGIAFETALESDCAPLGGLVEALLAAAPSVRCLRDPTRGGLASALHEIAAASRVGIVLDEALLPLDPAVRGACELLGLDPLYVACEGRLAAIVPEDALGPALAALRSHPLGRGAVAIGRVALEHPGVVTARSLGGERIVALLAGEQLPRIC